MSKYMKSTYEYTKKRKNFGRQPLFQSVPAQMLDSIFPDIKEQKLYTLRNPVNRHVQATLPQSENDANTKQLVTHEQGINHTEGGWPREVHVYNEDHVARHRRRIMHDENYVHTVMNLAPVIQHYVDQNNAIDMYQTYFAEMNNQEPVEKYNVRVANVFRDPFHRPVSSIVWTNEKKSKLAVAYCDRSCAPELMINKINTCYLWDICVQNEPAHTLEPDCPCWQMACSPKDPEILIGGLENGTVCVFDIREGSKAISYSSVYNSHRNPITSLLYIHSRSQTEFFTGSPDGQCLWWDLRKLSEPIDQLSMSIKIGPGQKPDLSNAEGVSTLQFDHGLPTKFLCGTESGYVINVNRMGREHSEVLASYWDAHVGPVRSVHRSPCTLRMFLTCGDYSVRIWSEEVRTAPIIVTKPYHHEVADAEWAPLRYSCYMSICAGGIFYYWDLLRKYKEPVATLKVSKHELTKLAAHVDGHFVAIGDNKGTTFLVSLSENMALPGSRDKQLVHQVYDRETKREHILDNRVKEIHLKQRAEEEAAKAKEAVADDSPDEDEMVQAAEDEYFKVVQEELRNIEGSLASIHFSK
ncbi:dynein intermediate chain 3, ciliary-like [Ostrinia furnacalis]|uniref:dynein intermediate chain 3, ciliary-like n=1 Tax=Ostrinia furnacalis TaxID=93504 RepID=UPI00103CC5C5|nr:dynein intermediate chain 3, ciliary-like [Ostrinia furnacalis]